MNVRWSNRAATEFAATAAYVASEFGQRAALKMRNSIDKAVEDISQFPNIGVASFTDEETSIDRQHLEQPTKPRHFVCFTARRCQKYD